MHDPLLTKPVPEVPYLCGYNAGRSQLAASPTDRYAAGRVQVRCAGSHPAGDACPILTGKRCLDREMPDPAGKPLPDVRVIRDDIDARVRALVSELTTSGAAS